MAGEQMDIKDVMLEPGYYWYRSAEDADWEVVLVGEGPVQWVSRFKGGHGQLQKGDMGGAFTGPIFVTDLAKEVSKEINKLRGSKT